MAESERFARAVAVVLGAVAFGIIGATAGSWIGSLNPGPLPDNVEALRMAADIVPGVVPAGELDRRDYVYGSRLGDEESGQGYVEILYASEDDEATLDEARDCSLDGLARDSAERHGWAGFAEITGYICASWRAQKDDLVVVYVNHGLGPELTFYRATIGPTAGALIGALFGALAGAAAGHAWRRHPVPLIVVLTPPALVLVPFTVLILAALLSGDPEEPFPPFWTLGPTLARAFFFYW
ncbi:hypothetical protein [Actinoplanes sp. NBRC 101535]|uniref:hypothetical protein n=1 Tax=Actinoplanes sp. NBRC 101535 TaxID=3032196 RepID=UPI0024A09407|nr:hypothetical protein [Actinoplanes sp. NBRC 101535]GLY04072.1 hypothetical protein Acsp01_44510 [Actinoplanes sp. NBRC 101535]